MRAACAVVLVAFATHPADACPRRQDADLSGTTTDAPTTASCLAFDWNQLRSVFELRYAVGLAGVTRTGIGGVASGYLALDLVYALQFGRDPEQPSYEIEVSGGATGHRFTGAVDANALVTRAGLRLGPARLDARIHDRGANIATFPMTLE